MRLLPVQNLIAKAISRGRDPANPAMLQMSIDFSADANYSFSADLSRDSQNRWGIAGVQAVFVDNRVSSTVTLIVLDNGFTISAPPYSQGIYPVLYSGQLLSFLASNTAGAVVGVVLLNSREQSQLWAAQLPVAGSISVSNSVVYTRPNIGTFVDASATLAVAATPQLLIAANGARQTLMIRNPALAGSQNIAAPESIYLGFSDAAVTVGKLGSWELLPGEQLPQSLMTTTENIYWVAATAGHRLTCKYM